MPKVFIYLKQQAMINIPENEAIYMVMKRFHGSKQIIKTQEMHQVWRPPEQSILFLSH